MKKAISLLVIFSFIGTMIVMTGCLGGGDGIGAIVAAVFVISIVASAGTTATPVVFAANVKPNQVRAATISKATDNISVVITPLDANGAKTGTPTTLTGDSLTISNGQISTSSSISQTDGYNQYLIEVKAGSNVILKQVQYLRNSQKTGTISAAVNSEATAKALLYDEWLKKNPTTKTYETFEANLTASTANVTTLKNNIDNNLSTNGANATYTSIGLTTEAAKIGTDQTVKYKATGFVTAADKVSGSDGTMINVTKKSDSSFVGHFSTTSGNYEVTGLESGVTYVFTPEKADHTYTPSSIDVTISGEDKSGINFQAARQSFAANQH
jgi:hypothetical protein